MNPFIANASLTEMPACLLLVSLGYKLQAEKKSKECTFATQRLDFIPTDPQRGGGEEAGGGNTALGPLPLPLPKFHHSLPSEGHSLSTESILFPLYFLLVA